MNETSHRHDDDVPAGSVVMISGDLIFSSRVRSAAQRAGLQFRVAGNLPEDDTESIRFVVLDLSTRSKLTGEIAVQCNERCPSAKLIAYGPHVQVDKLSKARESGIETVMTNGQFNNLLPQIFAPM